jgi:preprotein translocase subunit SecD
MRHRVAGALASLVLAAAAATSACSLPSVAPCDLVIAGIGDPDVATLPADAEILAAADDVDPAGWARSEDEGGGTAIDLRLRAEAAERLESYTADHVGGYLAIVLNGTVVSTPMIMAAIPDGALTLVGGTADGDRFEALDACLPVELLPAS